VPTAAGLAAFSYLIVFGSIIGFSAYIWLLHHVRPALAGSYAYVNPAIAVMLGAALALLLWGETHGDGGFIAHDGIASWGWAAAALLVFGGVLTALPLIGFADAVKRIPYSMVGVLQYIAPTLQLLCGVLVLGEAFDTDRAIGFIFIWIALAVYAVDGMWRSRRAS
jgi:EamA domain-containing membrane protein RarD